jgi:hypothetical protein
MQKCASNQFIIEFVLLGECFAWRHGFVDCADFLALVIGHFLWYSQSKDAKLVVFHKPSLGTERP